MWQGIKDRLSLLKTNTINSYQIQTAYYGENWGSLASTAFYSFTMILFINILFSNVKSFAGYTYDETLLLLLITQLNFYSGYIWSTNNILRLIDTVRSGELDSILSKPVPALFFVTFRDISIVRRLQDSLPNLVILGLIINWTKIQTNLTQILLGILVFICGQISWHCFRFLLALPVFFIGQSQEINKFGASLGDTNNIPFEGFDKRLKFVFSSIIPSLVASQMAVSVFLNKSDITYLVTTSVVVAIVFLLLKQLGWVICMRNYTSASS